ncbi:hypothetical protein DV735_g1118, partial [Chaetothyriales sp. CBS 134920]
MAFSTGERVSLPHSNQKECDGIQLEHDKAAFGNVPASPALEYPPEEEAKVVRKLDFRLLPIVFLLYSFSVLDRSNLGNAKLAGLEDDVDLRGDRYDWLGTVFYISYIVSQPLQMGWKKFPPHIFCAAAVFLWGFVATIQVTVTSWGALMTCRWFLGTAEAMFGPGVPLYLSFFYPREKIGFRHGVFIAGAAAANVYGGILAYALSHVHSRTLHPWKLLFIVEGVPTCLLAVYVFFFLPDSISQCRFLSDREKQVAAAANSRNQKGDADRKGGFRLSEVLEAFKDPKSYIPALIYFSINVSFASLPLFVPTIISQMGTFNSQTANGLSAPPYALCFFVILLATFLSDRYQVRGPFNAGIALIAAAGFIMLATTEDVAPRYAGVYLAVLIFTCIAVTLSWTANLHATESKRAGGLTILQTIGQCGPLLGTNLFPTGEKPYYRKGMWISAGFCILVAVLSASLSLLLIYENREMERKGLIARKGEQLPEGEDCHDPRYFRNIW